MTRSPDQLDFLARIKLRWHLLLRFVLHLWVKAKVLPEEEGEPAPAPEVPVCYVLADYALSSVLILDQVCEQRGLDRPLLPLSSLERAEPRAYACLRRLSGLLFRRPSSRRNSEVLKRLVEHCESHPGAEILLVPVSVFVGRAPDTQTGITKILFAEDWELGGRLKRFLSTLVNGRDTFVQFSKPISLRELLDEGLGAPRSLRKVSRVLRIHFQKVRASVIGPDLSHRRTLIDRLLNSTQVKDAIADKARRDGISEEAAREVARDYALEIAANYSYSFVRLAYFLLDWFITRVFGTVEVRHFERFKAQALDHEIIYVPCHRSHADYILLSYLLYLRGFAVPHIAAGINLNLPVVGSLVRRGGAFYLRRSFRSQKLYSAVFSEYVSVILAEGVSIEYFIEGTRSRTGRLLPAKGGMLAISVRSYLRAPTRPVMFQPVYLGYEQLLEGSAYTHELSGAAKPKESVFDLFRALRLLGKSHGAAHVSFGEPVFLDQVLTAADPDWRSLAGTDAKPVWMSPTVNQLGEQIMRAINACAHVNPVNLLATILLAAPRHALPEEALAEQIEMYRYLLERGPAGGSITVTDADAAAIVNHGFELGLLKRTTHQLGDIISLAPDKAVGMTYFRNNSAHLFALPALIASCFLRQRSITLEQLRRVTRDIYPYLRGELTLPWPAEQLPELLEATVVLMEARGLLARSADGTSVRRAEGGSPEGGQMTLLARTLLPTLERIYITIAVLAKNGSGMLNRHQLERLCLLTAQRISLLQEFEAPEFYDRELFRQFISGLRQQGVLVGNEDDRLEFSEQLARMGEDSRFFLEKGIRHAIIQVAPQVLEATDSDA